MKDYSFCQNIIFDFGGVLLDIDYSKTEQALADLHGQGSHAGFAQERQSPLFNEVETGAISANEFRSGLRQVLENNDVSDADLDAAWSALLGALRLDAIDYVRHIKDRKRVFLLSNINEIHLASLRRDMKKRLGSVEAFEGLFEQVYYSHEIGLRKPHKEVFQRVVNDHGLKLQETLFIDDSIQHVEGAKKLGLVSHCLQGSLLDLTLL